MNGDNRFVNKWQMKSHETQVFVVIFMYKTILQFQVYYILSDTAFAISFCKTNVGFSNYFLRMELKSVNWGWPSIMAIFDTSPLLDFYGHNCNYTCATNYKTTIVVSQKKK